MSKSLLLIFNHTLTKDQEKDARTSLGVSSIISFPPDLAEIWQQIPANLQEIEPFISPIKDWILSESQSGDPVLIQGDFGACFIMVNFAFQKGLVPVYSTTMREAVEKHRADGSIEMIHQFKHQRFRRYEKSERN